jgi:excisionase family DNA binding protein
MSGLLKIKEAAKLLALSESMIRKMLNARQLTPVRIGRSVRVRSADIEAFIARGGQ